MADIKTGVDKLVALVHAKKSVTFDQAASELQVDRQVLQDWADFLKDEGVVTIKYGLLHTTIEERPLTPEEYAAKQSAFDEQRETFLNKVTTSIQDLDLQTQNLSQFKAEFEAAKQSLGTDFTKLQKEFQELEKFDSLREQLKSLESQHKEYHEKEAGLEALFKEHYSKYKELLSTVELHEARLTAQQKRVGDLLSDEHALRSNMAQDEATLARISQTLANLKEQTNTFAATLAAVGSSAVRSSLSPAPVLPAPSALPAHSVELPAAALAQRDSSAIAPALAGSAHLPPLPPFPPLPGAASAPASSGAPVLPELPAMPSQPAMPTRHELLSLPKLPPLPATSAKVASKSIQDNDLPQLPPLPIKSAADSGTASSAKLPPSLAADSFDFPSFDASAPEHVAIKSRVSMARGDKFVSVVESEPEERFVPIAELDDVLGTLTHAQHTLMGLSQAHQDHLGKVEHRKAESLAHISRAVAGIEDDLLVMHEKVFKVMTPKHAKVNAHHSQVKHNSHQ